MSEIERVAALLRTTRDDGIPWAEIQDETTGLTTRFHTRKSDLQLWLDAGAYVRRMTPRRHAAMEKRKAAS